MRNPTMILLLTYGVIFGASIVGTVLAFIIPFMGLIFNLVSFVGAVLLIYFLVMMLLDLQKVTNDPSFMWWLVFIPCANLYLLWMLAPAQVAKAKQMAGLPNPVARGIVLYIFLAPYALAADLNDLAAPGSAPPAGPLGLGGGFGAPPGLGMGAPPPPGPPPGPGGYGPPGMGR